MVVKDDIKSKLIEGHIFFLPMDGKEEVIDEKIEHLLSIIESQKKKILKLLKKEKESQKLIEELQNA